MLQGLACLLRSHVQRLCVVVWMGLRLLPQQWQLQHKAVSQHLSATPAARLGLMCSKFLCLCRSQLWPLPVRQ
jgi:hypothetical protein